MRDHVKSFLSLCAQSYEDDDVISDEELVSLLAKTARGDTPSSTNQSFQFMCPIIPIAKPHFSCSTVMALATLTKYLIDVDKVGPHAFLLSNPDPTDPMLGKAIDALNNNTDFCRAGATLGGSPTHLFWVAPTADLPQRPDSADEMRDSLGLIQHGKGNPLVELTIPSDRLAPCRWARPTFADGGINRRFRFRPDAQRRPPHSDWGCTVHLALFADGDSNIDGVPECVVSPVPFDNELHATLRFLGTTRITRGDTTRDDDRAFADRLGRGRRFPDSLEPLFT